MLLSIVPFVGARFKWTIAIIFYRLSPFIDSLVSLSAINPQKCYQGYFLDRGDLTSFFFSRTL